MNIRRKGLSVAFTATLLSSLLATVAAPAVAGAVTIPTGAGNVPRGGTSANTLVINFTENSAACIPAGGGTVTYTIDDAAPSAGDVTFSGTPTIVGPGSLGTTASVAGSVLTLTFAGSDLANIEQVTVSGLAISASATASAGAIVAVLGGTVGGCFTGAAAANGLLAEATGIGATTVIVAVSSPTCAFVPTGTPLVGVSPAVTAGNLVLGSESRAITAVAPGPLPGQQSLTLGAALGVTHPANEPATQSGACLGAPSPGTVANALTQTVGAPTRVLPGENNQPVANVILSELPSGTPTTFVNGQVVTFTITNPAAGVLFSSSPTLTRTSGPVTAGSTCALSFDRRSCTATIAGATAGDDVYTLTNILVDVDATVPLGTPVRIVASIPSVAINVTATNQIVAFVARVVVGVAAQPTIFIGVNDQVSGMITLTESGAGFFRAGVGANNTFALCLATGETFTRAPWAVVTNAGGTGGSSLQLLSGLVGVSQAQGTLYNDGRCAYWTVFSASTTGAGTIEIRGSADGSTPLASGANNGPRLSVGAGLSPGTTQAAILIGEAGVVVGNTVAATGVSDAGTTATDLTDATGGFGAAGSQVGRILRYTSGPAVGQDRTITANTGTTITTAAFGPAVPTPGGGDTYVIITPTGGCTTVAGCQANAAFSSLVSNAVRAFRSGVVVAATSRPIIERGDTDALAGNITITETSAGQFKPGQTIFVQVLARATTLRQDVLLNTANTNNQPIITTNSASGLLVSPVNFGPGVPGVVCQNAIPLVAICGFTITISQQAFGPTLGQITISNIKYFVLPDAVLGPVQVQVSSSGATGGPVNGVAFQEVVSNAVVGTAATRTSINNTSAIGVTTTGAFTASTKVVQRTNYITWRATMSPSMSGERVVVWIARKAANGTWGAFTRFSTRAVNAQGIAYFHYDNGDNPGWISVKFTFLGNNQHAAGSSLARQGRYL